jgi:hypothetical protein
MSPTTLLSGVLLSKSHEDTLALSPSRFSSHADLPAVSPRPSAPLLPNLPSVSTSTSVLHTLTAQTDLNAPTPSVSSVRSHSASSASVRASSAASRRSSGGSPALPFSPVSLDERQIEDDGSISPFDATHITTATSATYSPAQLAASTHLRTLVERATDHEQTVARARGDGAGRLIPAPGLSETSRRLLSAKTIEKVGL